MHLLQVFSLLFSFVMISSVFPKALGVHVAQSTTSSVIRFNIIDFQVNLFSCCVCYGLSGTIMTFLSYFQGTRMALKLPALSKKHFPIYLLIR
jgi:hypothetical protein